MKRETRFVIGAALIWVGVSAATFMLAPPAPTAHAQGAGLPFTCFADDIAATLTKLTLCDDMDPPAAPGMRRYITDVVAQSTTTTSGLWILRHGTGTNCGTGVVSLLPAAATVVRLAAPANTGVPTVLSFKTPLIVPSGRDLCVLGVATDTVTIQVNGYVAP